MHGGALALLVALAVAGPGSAWAQGNLEKARTLARSAKQLALDGNYADALSLYDKAHALYPAPELLYAIGRVADRKGDLPRARQALERYLQDEKDPEDLARGRAALQEVMARWPALVRVTCAQVGALVEVDGAPAGHTPLAKPLELAPGSHRLKVSAARKQPFERIVEAEPEQSIDVVAALKDAPALVTVAPTPGTARVLLDGKPLGPDQRKDVALDSGKHAVRVEADGHEPQVAWFDVQPGEVTTVTVALKAKAPPSAQNDLSGGATLEKKGLSTTSWVLIGTGVAALVAGGVATAVLLSTRGSGRGSDASFAIRTEPLEVGP